MDPNILTRIPLHPRVWIKEVYCSLYSFLKVRILIELRTTPGCRRTFPDLGQNEQSLHL